MARTTTSTAKSPPRDTRRAKRSAPARGSPPPPASKTAVVVIHGIGEQRPLETLREFVETVYRRDRSIASMGAAADGLLNISVVPDDVTGSAELRRITTHSDGPQKRTDFFEFYWADIMDGTPLDMVTGWIRTLLLRSPLALPRALKVRWAWGLLWLVTLIVLAAGAITAKPDLLPFIASPSTMQGVGAALAAARPVVVSIIIVLAVLLALVRVIKVKGFVILAAIGLVLTLVPSALADSVRFWAGVLTLGVGWGMHALVAPYAGDVVRYVRATPSTVERRRLVRERGLALLEALHAKRRNGPALATFAQAPDDDPPLYDRIVIVGHSLGTVVGYDILQLFWEKHGPTHHQDWNPEAPGVQEALAVSDGFVRAAWGTPAAELFDGPGFAASQAALFAALAKQSPGWRISDFITLGCPLTHGEFLLVDTATQLKQATRERRFATAPPYPDPFLQNSMLFTRTGMALRADGTAEPLFPHFAAQFAAVKWTNIFDESRNPLLGDLISGRVSVDFGPGIAEHRVTIERAGWPPLLRRLFTHTQYWRWHESYEPSPANVAEADRAMAEPDESRRRALLWENVPEHIRQLRTALRLGT